MPALRLSNIRFFDDESVVTFELITKQQTKNLIDGDEEYSEISIKVSSVDPQSAITEAKTKLRTLLSEATSSL